MARVDGFLEDHLRLRLAGASGLSLASMRARLAANRRRVRVEPLAALLDYIPMSGFTYGKRCEFAAGIVMQGLQRHDPASVRNVHPCLRFDDDMRKVAKAYPRLRAACTRLMAYKDLPR